MRITAVTGHVLSSAFTYGNPAGPHGASRGGNLHLRNMDTLLVRVETDAGITGWGEGFGFTLCQTTRDVVDRLIAPAAIGMDAADIAGTMRALFRRFHNFGRNGAASFGLSGLDIALWDIRGKTEGKPLHALLGGAKRVRVPAYASLLRYGEPALVAANAAKAVARGYRHLKLHEVRLDCIGAARDNAPPEVPLMLDINCAWDTVDQAVGFCRAVQGKNIWWVEEPTWPPEAFAPIAAVRAAGGVGIAAGENLGSYAEFAAMAAAGAVDVMQPSITKCGGVSVMAEVMALARAQGLRVVPHCPYFGPGLLASLHVLAASEREEPLEVYFADLALPPYPALVPQGGFIAVPDGPGLGLEPDPAALAAAL
jgi:L-alanine-DL-glutamate epimerase-like enolase superfamily enzyme